LQRIKKKKREELEGALGSLLSRKLDYRRGKTEALDHSIRTLEEKGDRKSAPV